VSAPGLSLRPNFNRYTEDAVDLCDVLSSLSAQSKVALDELSKIVGESQTVSLAPMSNGIFARGGSRRS
jgi:hypothetical protein